MSRETDTPSSGPNGRGGTAYPSGTPPYGVPAVSDDGADAGRSAAQPEERKTETTLTTRIRINIPGSRPIPPVVVRKPVADGEADTAGTRTEGADGRAAAEGSRPGGGSGPAAGPAGPAGSAGPSGDTGDLQPRGGGAANSGAENAASGASAASGEDKPTSDWFAPRKSSAAKGGQGGGGTNGAGLPGGSDAGGGSASGTAPGGPGGAAPVSDVPGGTSSGGGGRPGGVVGSMRAPTGSSRSAGGSGLPGATGGPVAPGHGGGTGSFDVTEALAAGPLSGGSRPGGPGSGSGSGGGEPRRDDLPYFTGNGQGAPADHPAQGGHGVQGGQGAPGGPSGPGGPGGFDGAGVPGGLGGPGGSPGPAGPTSGPMTGDASLLPHGGVPGAPRAGTGGAPGTSGAPGVPGAPGMPGAPGALSAHPGAGTSLPGGPGGGLSDDTAILTPQNFTPEPGAPGHGPRPDNVSGHTVTSGMPVISPDGTGGPRTDPAAPAPEPDRPSAPPAGKSAKAAKPKKKGRSKITLLGGLVVVAAGVAYGAGLLMNHSEVPKGTTVLGVDVGGGSRDDAVKKLDDAFGKREKQPLKLSVDGRTVSLRPDQAGLQLDTQATASAAAQSDYNPVSVIGSLFGNHRVVEPQMPVDEEKLQAALQNAAGGAGSATDGSIRFESGKAVAVYGKAGKGIDAARSVQAVAQAYRAQVETGSTAPVQVPTTVRQPTVSNAEVDRMMKAFAEPAMSAKVTVSAGPGHALLMSPEKSLWKFLGVKAVDGKLVEYYDQAKLKDLYGGIFDGVLITRGNGQKTPVTVTDVISALRPALVSRTDRVGVIDTNPN